MGVILNALEKISLWGIAGLVIVLSLSGIAHSDIIIDSHIIADTTWTKAGSPYVVKQAIDIYPNVTLTIESGVEVKFEVGSNLDIFGALVAIGSESEMIFFTTTQTTPSAGYRYWKGLVFKENGMGTVDDENGNYVSGSILKYCQVSYGEGITSNVRLFILNCLISLNAKYQNSYFSDDPVFITGGGISIIADNSIISGNKIVNNYLQVESYDFDVVTAHGGGLYYWGTGATISDNIIDGNKIIAHGYTVYAWGGGVCSRGGFTIFARNTITNNIIDRYFFNDHASGAGLWQSGGAHIYRNSFSNNLVINTESGQLNSASAAIVGNGPSFIIEGNTILNSHGGQGA